MKKIRRIFHEILGIEEERVTDSLSYQSCEKWDSIRHLKLVAAFEKEFGIELETDDIVAMENVGKIKEILRRHHVRELD